MTANVWAKMAKRIHWYPHKMARLANRQSVSVEGAMPDAQAWHGHKVTKQAKSDENRHSEPRRANADCT